MNVCFLIRALDRGGAELQLVRLARELVRRGHEVTLVTYYGGGPLEAELAGTGVTLRSLGKASRWQVWQPLWRLVAEVKAARAEVLHAYLPTSNVLALLARPWLAGVAVVCGVRASNMSLARYDTLTAWSYRVERRLMHYADRVICNSGAAATLYGRFTTTDRISVVANGVDTDHYVPDDKSRAATRRAWGFGDGVRLIGLVARADPMKDHATFLDAAAIAHRSDPSLRFVCITQSESPTVRVLEEAARGLGIADAVLWCGPYDELAAVYPAFDLLTLTSAYGEGFPNVIAEAMACGISCVATDVGDARKIIGDTGIVVPPGDAEALAQAWRHQLDAAPPADENAPARRRIVARYGVDRLVDETERVMSEVVR